MDDRIVASWKKNAEPWTRAVRANEIASRVLVTNAAIVEAVMSRAPRSVLDVGCGEGWLTRELAARGVRCIGVDVVPELIERARQARPSEADVDYQVASYEELARGAVDVRVNAVVANFSLLGKESVDGVIASARRLLTSRGSLVIQTLHPVSATLDTGLPYQDGWRTGSWSGFSAAFTDPAPWYFRTIGSWVRLLVGNGWQLLELREPVDPRTGRAASAIFIAQAAG